MVSAAMQQGITFKDTGRPLAQDTDENWKSIAFDQEVPPMDTSMFIGLAREALRRNNDLVRKGSISFDDQVYYPVVHDCRFPRYPLMTVDESQDLNPLNHAMMRLAQPEQLAVFGDPKQAIYAFRGADSRSMDKILGLQGGEARWTQLPLATTFRCPKSIVARQQAHAPGFTAYHTNRDGQVGAVGDAEDGWSWLQVMEVANAVNSEMSRPGAPQLAVLCRNNAPLVSLAFKLIRSRVGVYMAGRELGKGLVTLSKKIAPEGSTPAPTIMAKLHEWQETQVSLARANRKEDSIEGILDRAECIRAVLEDSECRDAEQLRAILDRLFSGTTGLVTLSSIHRAKGLEWDTVIHLDPWRIPSRFALQSASAGDPTQLEQEQNLLYVCETRTKHTLIPLSLEDFSR